MADSSRWRNLATNVILAVASLLAVSLAAEGALRWVLLRNLNPFEPDPNIGYRLKRGFQGVYPRVKVRTDSLGRRVPADFDGDATGRFLFVGDSVTFGFGVLAEQSFPALVGERMGALADAANAGVPGYNLGQVLATLREQLGYARPEFVVYGLVVNDLGDADHPLTYEDIDPHASRIKSGGFLARSVLVAFVLRRWNRLAGRFADPEQHTAKQRAPLGNVVDFEQALSEATVAAFDRQWKQLEQLQQRQRLPVFAVIFPFRQQVEEQLDNDALQRFMTTRCRDSVVHCLDPLEMLRARRDEGLFNGGSSYHFSPHGHQVVADWLVRRIRSVLEISEAPAAALRTQVRTHPALAAGQ